MTLQSHAPIRIGDQIEVTTWLSTLERVRGRREYRVVIAETGELGASGLAEWVYVDRQTLRPMPLPPDLLNRLRVPGAPLGDYDPPAVPLAEAPRRFISRRSAQWYECDTHGHVNNTVYADWLDEAMRAALLEMGYSIMDLKAGGLQLRGIHYRFEYKRAALPGDNLLIETTLTGSDGALCAVEQRIDTDAGAELLSARSIYAWLTNDGEQAEPPEGW
jgi:YbgC/YbaW family acyl-CoA thioester hydrolase